ncbi:ribonuclease P protein subunit p30 [Culicoides brevitarsis]|uniref:ribonuclease P protein subunit p30 n=1 Tax=Culicoides brevitarsis TaxID=469753 RepID=UPI00307BC4F9
MEPLTGFCDLCVSNFKDLKELTLMLRELVELEYKNVAIEQIYNDVTTDQKAKKNDPIPEPLDLSIFEEEFKGKLKIFNRISVIFAENSVSLTTNKSQNLRKYHLFAAIPTTESALIYACQSLNCDLISYNADTIRVKIARKHYFEACSRNIYFEIKYAPCIVDAEVRKSTITKAHKYHALGKSRNIIMSSGAKEQFELRSPYDVAYLGWIFNLSEEQSKDAICGKSRRLLLRAETRRSGSCIVHVRKLKELGVSKEEDISDTEDEEEKMSVSEAESGESASKKQKIN